MSLNKAKWGNDLPDLLPFPVGQPLAYSLLSAAVASSKLARVYWFSGMPGIGKAMAARWMAAQILWQQRRSSSRLSPEALATQVKAGSHSDLVWVEPTCLVNGVLQPESQVPQLRGQVRIEQAVELRRRLQEASIGQRWMVIIDGADRLTNEAGNALLKLLEDHRQGCFILIGSGQVLPTIRSRAQMVRFVPLSEADCRAVVSHQYPELVDCDDVIQFAGGSPGLAIRAYECLCAVPAEIRTEFSKFAPTSQSGGVLQALRMASALATLSIDAQKLLLRFLQHQLWQHYREAAPLEHSRRLLAAAEQALSVLEHRVQAQAAWEVLLLECAMGGVSWSLSLPSAPVGSTLPVDPTNAAVVFELAKQQPQPAKLSPVEAQKAEKAESSAEPKVSEVSQLSMF